MVSVIRNLVTRFNLFSFPAGKVAVRDFSFEGLVLMI